MAQKRIKIVYKLLDELIPDENNPRRNDDAVPAVMESIREFGFRVPIVVDNDNIIRAGHTRYKAAKLLGEVKVPCVVASDLDEKQIKAFQLADNKTGELVTWDNALLNMEMSELAGLFDMSLFGFVKKDGESLVGGDGEGAASTKKGDQYVTCPRCGKIFLRSAGHPKKGTDPDTFLNDNPDVDDFEGEDDFDE